MPRKRLALKRWSLIPWRSYLGALSGKKGNARCLGKGLQVRIRYNNNLRDKLNLVFLLPSPVCSNVTGTDNPDDMSEEPSTNSAATQGDPSEAPPPPYGPPQPGYLPAELVDPPPRVRYSPAGNQTASLQDIHSIDVVDRPARQITRQESANWRKELQDCCLIWCSTCGDICK